MQIVVFVSVNGFDVGDVAVVLLLHLLLEELVLVDGARSDDQGLH